MLKSVVIAYDLWYPVFWLAARRKVRKMKNQNRMWLEDDEKLNKLCKTFSTKTLRGPKFRLQGFCRLRSAFQKIVSSFQFFKCTIPDPFPEVENVSHFLTYRGLIRYGHICDTCRRRSFLITHSCVYVGWELRLEGPCWCLCISYRPSGIYGMRRGQYSRYRHCQTTLFPFWRKSSPSLRKFETIGQCKDISSSFIFVAFTIIRPLWNAINI